jgi:hypothetical protein
MNHLDICSASYGQKKAGSQTGNLTPNHKKSGIDLFLTFAVGVQHGVEKLSMRATSLVESLFRSKFEARSYERPKSRESKPGQFRDSSLGVSRKRAIWM